MGNVVELRDVEYALELRCEYDRLDMRDMILSPNRGFDGTPAWSASTRRTGTPWQG